MHRVEPTEALVIGTAIHRQLQLFDGAILWVGKLVGTCDSLPLQVEKLVQVIISNFGRKFWQRVYKVTSIQHIAPAFVNFPRLRRLAHRPLWLETLFLKL